MHCCPCRRDIGGPAIGGQVDFRMSMLGAGTCVPSVHGRSRFQRESREVGDDRADMLAGTTPILEGSA